MMLRNFFRLLSALFFAITCFVGFLVLMFFNLSISEDLLPGITSNLSEIVTGKTKAVLALLISCPIPVVVCFLWYRLFDYIDKKFFKQVAGAALISETFHPTSEEPSLRSALAACAGMTFVAVIMGVGIGLNILSYFWERGRLISESDVVTLFFGVVGLVAVLYVVARSRIVSKYR
jgi:ABC-type phosphate transport system permease subunit